MPPLRKRASATKRCRCSFFRSMSDAASDEFSGRGARRRGWPGARDIGVDHVGDGVELRPRRDRLRACSGELLTNWTDEAGALEGPLGAPLLSLGQGAG